jgi:hypothetical protein
VASAFELLSSASAEEDPPAKEPFPRQAEGAQGLSSRQDEEADVEVASSASFAAELGPGWIDHDATAGLHGLRAVRDFVTAAVDQKQADPLEPFATEHKKMVSGSGFEEVRRGRAAEVEAPRRALKRGQPVVVHIRHLPTLSQPEDPDTLWFGCVVHTALSATRVVVTDPTLSGVHDKPFTVEFDDLLVSPMSAGGSQVPFVVSEVVLARFQEDAEDDATGYYPAQVLEDLGKSFKVRFDGDSVESRLVASVDMVRNLSTTEDEEEDEDEALIEDYMDNLVVVEDADDDAPETLEENGSANNSADEESGAEEEAPSPPRQRSRRYSPLKKAPNEGYIY